MGKKAVLLVVLGLVTVFGVGYLAGRKTSPNIANPQQTTNDYPFLAARLFLDNPSDIRINFSPLRTQLNNYYTTNKLDGSIYFEYLPTGTSIRVNSNQNYRAASLIKLPVAMEAYKAKELGKLDLSTKVSLKQEWLNSDYGELYKKGAGYTLTIEEAIKIMLIDSDNTALRVVIDATDKALELKDRALGSLDIEFTVDQQDGLYIGTRSYASFLKCLYFACYNDKTDSQKILEMLSETRFNDRLAAGVSDKSIKVSHKIGVFNTEVQGDCGIVYVPGSNYALCVMLKADATPETDAHFAAISKIVFDYVLPQR